MGRKPFGLVARLYKRLKNANRDRTELNKQSPLMETSPQKQLRSDFMKAAGIFALAKNIERPIVTGRRLIPLTVI